MKFVLASASPARLRTLRSAGLYPQVIVSGVDESTVDGSTAIAVCATLARRKAEAVLAAIPSDQIRTVVLGCDSMLELDGQILGKPDDAADATARWRQLRGRSGVLHTGHCLIDVATRRVADAVASTTVHFADVTDDEIGAYVATGEPLRVAGAFTIDGLGGWFVERIEGDPGTVVGLSLPLLRQLLAQIGIGIDQLWGHQEPHNV